MSEKQPRAAQPPDLISGPLSPENNAWLVTQMAKGYAPGSSGRRQWEAVAQQNGYESDEYGNFVPGVEITPMTEVE